MAAEEPTRKKRLMNMLKNKVKKCTSCAKPNAFTLRTCNQCGTSLEDTPISYTNNVFTSFALGIASGPFPFAISIRAQTRDVLVLDDLLGLSPCHLNVIPTTVYIPDWRYLLLRPQEGLELITKMYDACVDVVRTQFLSSAEWRRTFLQAGLTDDDVLACVASGFNYPPSQYQLHTQFMLPVLMPFQFYQYKCGVHYTHRRFFPSAYVRQVLQKCISAPTPVRFTLDELESEPLESLLARITRELGVDYDALHGSMFKEFEMLQNKIARWDVSMFEGVVIENSTYVPFAASSGATPEDVAQIVREDKVKLQSYGRPYGGPNGVTPTGSYYSYPKTFEELDDWTQRVV